jgi:uncharacterized membrane protein YfcA
LDHITALTILAVAGGIVTGGVVKGTTGIGLPMVAMPIMVLAVDVPTAVALMTFPILASNIVQGVQGGRWKVVIRRFWPLSLIQPLGMVAGAMILAWANQRILTGILGGMVVFFVVAVQFQPNWHISPAKERFITPIVGALSGLSGGLSSFFGLPIAMYLLMLRMEKDEFVSAVGVTYTFGGISLIVVLGAFGLLGQQLYLYSILSIPAVLVGVWLGNILRARLDPATFRKAVLVILFIAGLNLIRRAVMG